MNLCQETMTEVIEQQENRITDRDDFDVVIIGRNKTDVGQYENCTHTIPVVTTKARLFGHPASKSPKAFLPTDESPDADKCQQYLEVRQRGRKFLWNG